MANLSDSLKNSLLTIARSREDAVELQTTLEKARTIAAGTNVTVTDNGETVTINASGGGGTPTGTPNTVAQYDGAGDLSSSGIVVSLGDSLQIGGSIDKITNQGSIVSGISDGAHTATNHSLILGQTSTGGTITADLYSVAHGQSLLGSAINVPFFGHAHGLLNASATFDVTGYGAHGHGVSANGGGMTASGNGSTVAGETNAATIEATGIGSIASGDSASSGQLLSQGPGSLALGQVAGVNSIVNAQEAGAIAAGRSLAGFELSAAGFGTLALGQASTGNVIVDGTGSAIFSSTEGDVGGDSALGLGEGINNGSYASIVVGRYNVPGTPSPNTWVATDHAFVVGNGTGVGTEADGFRIDKDGKVLETAAKREAAYRYVNLNDPLLPETDNVSARTDRTLIVNIDSAGGTVFFPAPEDGLVYEVVTEGSGPTNYTLDYTTNGGTVTSAPTTITGTTFFTVKCFAGAWYQVG